MEFQVQMCYEEEDVAALVRTLDYRRHPEKKIRMARRLGYPIFGILMIMAGVGMLANGLVDIVGILIFLVTILIGILFIRRADTQGMQRRSWKKYPNKGLVLTYRFYRDHFEEEDEISGKNEFSYLSLANGNEDENHFFLFTKSNQAHMLRKDGFLTGDPADFPDYLKKQAAIHLDPIES